MLYSVVKVLSALIPHRALRHKIRNVCLQKKLKKTVSYLKRYCTPFVGIPSFDEKNPHDLPIWQLWFQGEENAPEIVKKCFASVKRHSENRKHIILDEKSWKNYIKLPEYIMDKCQKGIISKPHLSDIIRVCLLEKYGGTWIDATILMTGDLPRAISASPIFLYKAVDKWFVEKYRGFTLGPNGFMHAQPGHIIIKNIRSALFKYWEKENRAADYLFFHLMLKILIETDPALQKLFDEIPTRNYIYNNRLQMNLHSPFDENLYENIISQTSVHKLNHKIRENSKLKGSFFEKILET